MEFESRESTRIDSNSLISYKVIDSEGNVFNEGVASTIDISKTGIAIQLESPYEIGTLIELKIGVGNEVINANGKVRNIIEKGANSFQLGVEFDFLSEKDLNTLSIYFPHLDR